MDEPTSTADNEQFRPTPELPKPLLDPWPLAIVGTGVWALIFVVVLMTDLSDLWWQTALTGTGLGFLGMAVMFWQRIGKPRTVRQRATSSEKKSRH